MSEVVIKVENLSKQYRLGVIGHGALSKDLQSWWARVRGTEDPNAKLDHSTAGQDNNLGDRFWALQDVSFEVRRGEILGIIGRNGAGKSTLLKILSRVTAPTSGSIKVKGRVASLLEVGTGFHPELTGRENVFLNGTILGMTKSEIEDKFDEIVAFAEIERFIDTPVKRYSSGMYVRLAFAVAAHLDPEILVVDEVLAVGDASFQKKCLGKMGEVAREGRTVLFVSHNMGAVKALCSRGICLGNGRIIKKGEIEEVIDYYFEKNYYNCKNHSINSYKREKGIGIRAKIIDVSISNIESNEDDFIDSSKPLLFTLKIEACENLSCSCQISIRNQFQNLILFSSELQQNVLFNFKAGIFEVHLHMDPCYLSSGTYYVTCGLARGPHEWIDYLPDAYKLNIQNLDIYMNGFDYSQKYGAFHVNHNWVVRSL